MTLFGLIDSIYYSYDTGLRVQEEIQPSLHKALKFSIKMGYACLKANSSRTALRIVLLLLPSRAAYSEPG